MHGGLRGDRVLFSSGTELQNNVTSPTLRDFEVPTKCSYKDIHTFLFLLNLKGKVSSDL
jgi:hypothetical protein